MTSKKARQYWIHVHDDGTEQVFDSPPSDLKTLRIWIMGERFEETRTYNVVFNNEKGKEAALRVKPKGQGWELFETHEMFSTVWRRRAK